MTQVMLTDKSSRGRPRSLKAEAAIIDPQMGLDIIYGPDFMRLMSESASITEDDAEAMVRLVFAGVTVRKD